MNAVVQYKGPSAANASRSTTIDVTQDKPLPVRDFFHAVSQGQITGHSLVHKFGKNDEITTEYLPLAHGGLYPTPQISGAVNLRIKAGGNIQDNQAGTGARSVYVEGIGTDGALLTEILLPHATDGTLVGVSGTESFIRVFRCYVVGSGTYASIAAGGSHIAPITIENTGGTEDWVIIDGANLTTNFPRGQSQIGAYTVPLGYTAYVYSFVLTTDSGKPVDFLFFQRSNVLDTVAPYAPMKVVVEPVGVTGEHTGHFEGGQKFDELTDVGWMVKGATTPIATVDYEILLVAN